MRLPKPALATGNTGGPPCSSQLNVKTGEFHSSRKLTQPVATDYAPYLSALVSSSCRMSEKFCVICGPRTSPEAPLISN